MQMFGFLLLGLSVLATIVALHQRSKNKKILATPYKRTAEIAANPGLADANGNVSCEGAIVAQAPAYAPCSGAPCLYYEVEVIQEWTKTVATEDGMKQETGRTSLSKSKSGVLFYVNDGSGPVGVDPRMGMDVDMDKSFEQEQAVSFGDVMFGQFRAHVPMASDGKSGKGVRVIERIVPAGGQMFVLGKIDPQRNIGGGEVMASRKGRNHLLGATKRNATIGFVAAALFMLPGAGLAAFGEPMATDSLSLKGCEIKDDSAGIPCTGKIYSDFGSNVTLNVTKAATFEISGAAPAGKKIPLLPKLEVKDAAGKVAVKEFSSTTKVDLQPGTYTVNIHDGIPGSAKNFKGGFSYELVVKRIAELKPATVALAPPSVLPVGATMTTAMDTAADDTTTCAKGKKCKKAKAGKKGVKKTAGAPKATTAG